jgi:hypothetical protein
VDRQYLLTYRNVKDGEYDFHWFEDDEEMQCFINENANIIVIHDAIHIIQAEKIEYDPNLGTHIFD